MINSPRVCIQVQSVYIEAQSSPDNERYVFAYTVTIRNLGRAPVQLLGRYWLITNGNGRETEVQGEGVVGVQAYRATRMAMAMAIRTTAARMKYSGLMVSHRRNRRAAAGRR